MRTRSGSQRLRYRGVPGEARYRSDGGGDPIYRGEFDHLKDYMKDMKDDMKLPDGVNLTAKQVEEVFTQLEYRYNQAMIRKAEEEKRRRDEMQRRKEEIRVAEKEERERMMKDPVWLEQEIARMDKIIADMAYYDNPQNAARRYDREVRPLVNALARLKEGQSS